MNDPPVESRALLHRQVSGQLPGRDAKSVELFLWVTRLGRLMESFRQQVAPGASLDAASAATLTTIYLAAPEPLSASYLAKTVVQTSGGMTKTLQRLDDAGYITRTRNQDDGRGVCVALTALGRSKVEIHLADLLDRWQAILSLVQHLDMTAALSTIGDLAQALDIAVT